TVVARKAMPRVRSLVTKLLLAVAAIVGALAHGDVLPVVDIARDVLPLPHRAARRECAAPAAAHRAPPSGPAPEVHARRPLVEGAGRPAHATLEGRPDARAAGHAAALASRAAP